MAAKSPSQKIDIAFAVDCTQSMIPYMTNVVQNIRLIVSEISSNKTVSARFALIKFRDHPPEENTFVVRAYDFMNVETILKWLDECVAAGGGDGPEAVVDALHYSLNLSWCSEAEKICILVADAPPHGVEQKGDSFPLGCPCGYDPIDIARIMAKEHIKLYTVGVEPPLKPYCWYFMTLANMTNGEYIPAENTNGWSQIMIAKILEKESFQPESDGEGGNMLPNHNVQLYLPSPNDNGFNWH